MHVAPPTKKLHLLLHLLLHLPPLLPLHLQLHLLLHLPLLLLLHPQLLLLNLPPPLPPQLLQVQVDLAGMSN